MKSKKKKFDCIEMKKKAQEQLLKEVEGMTLEEKYAYWKEKAFLERQKELKTQRSSENLAA